MKQVLKTRRSGKALDRITCFTLDRCLHCVSPPARRKLHLRPFDGQDLRYRTPLTPERLGYDPQWTLVHTGARAARTQKIKGQSDQSIIEPLRFNGASVPQKSGTKRSSSPVSSCVSLKSDQSIIEPLRFNGASVSQESDDTGSEAAVKSDKFQKTPVEHLKNIFNELEKKIFKFIKDELEIYKKHLTNKDTKYHGDVKEDKWNLRQGVLNLTQYFLKKMEHTDLADALQSKRRQRIPALCVITGKNVNESGSFDFLLHN
ncbi:hypothetical protein MHYP_G00219670 [Metynnis hypsauchen]